MWFNPKGLFGLEDGGKVDGGDFHRLYHGFAPDGSGKLTRNAGSEKRSPGLDMTFSADKSVSALWAIADPDLRARIEQAHNDAARVALDETVFRPRRCSAIAAEPASAIARAGSRCCPPTSRLQCSSTAPAGTTTPSFVPTA